MNLFDAIGRRRSVRKYSGEELSDGEIGWIEGLLEGERTYQSDVSAGAALLLEGKRFQEDLSGVVANYGKVEAPHYLVLTSEGTNKGYVEIGYRYEYLVLALTATGVGTCWIGKGFDDDVLEDYVSIPPGQTCNALIAFGPPASDQTLDEIEKPHRRKVEDFVINGDGDALGDEVRRIVDCLRRAPSSINSQPWRVGIEDYAIHLFMRKRSGITRRFITSLSVMNRIDSGIGLCHLEVAGKKIWGDSLIENLSKRDRDGMSYIGSLVCSQG
ncbi:MAG: nitroreductase family protein [Candidatus Acetothermia bacterium]